MLSMKGIVSLISISRPPSLFLRRSSSTAAHPGVFSGLVLLVSLVSWIAAMLTLLLWRKVSSSVIFLLILFAYHCINRRQLVGVGVESGPDYFDIAGTLKQKSEQQCWHRPLRHQKGDLTIRESSEVLAVDSVGRRNGCEEATSILNFTVVVVRVVVVTCVACIVRLPRILPYLTS